MVGSGEKGMRTCVGCGASLPKRQLARIVRQAGSGVSFDETGRASGRGAYVCSKKCLEGALKSRKLQRALKTDINEEEAARIRQGFEECASKMKDDRS